MAVLALALEDSVQGDCARRVTQFGQILAARETVTRVVAGHSVARARGRALTRREK